MTSNIFTNANTSTNTQVVNQIRRICFCIKFDNKNSTKSNLVLASNIH